MAGRREVSGGDVTVVRELLMAQEDQLDGKMTEELSALADRLEKVRSWGAAYAQVDFSPMVKAAMNREHRVDRQVVMV